MSLRSATAVVQDPEEQICIPSFNNGTSRTLANCCPQLALKYHPAKGRHIVCSSPVKAGDVLFIENPFASVLLPEHCETRCQHCSQVARVPLPCHSCVRVIYCSEKCREVSWGRYHKYECHSLLLLHSIGIAHLALRIIFEADLFRVKKIYNRVMEAKMTKLNLNDESPQKLEMCYTAEDDKYNSVFYLISHVDKMNSDDVFQYTLTAVLLTMLLEEHAGTFCPTIKQDFTLLSAVLLHHVTQLVSNAHAITDMQSVNSDDPYSDVSVEEEVRVATAIYTSASMMNHSCKPSVINNFHKNTLIVKAIADIDTGGEVFNCYGPQFPRMKKKERQSSLMGQYFFNCKCSACLLPIFKESQVAFLAYHCPDCDGPLCSQESQELEESQETGILGECLSCHKLLPISDQIVQSVAGDHFYSQGEEEFKKGAVDNALERYKKCESIWIKCLYSGHENLAKVRDRLAHCYGMLGNCRESIVCLQKCIPAMEIKYGRNSIEVAYEFQKISDVLFAYLKDLHPQHEDYEIVLKKLKATLKKGLKLFDLHRGIWSDPYKEMKDKSDFVQKNY